MLIREPGAESPLLHHLRSLTGRRVTFLVYRLSCHDVLFLANSRNMCGRNLNVLHNAPTADSRRSGAELMRERTNKLSGQSGDTARGIWVEGTQPRTVSTNFIPPYQGHGV